MSPSVVLKVFVMYLHIPSAMVVGSLIHVASVYTLIFLINMPFINVLVAYTRVRHICILI
jgi:hypothetical protein